MKFTSTIDIKNICFDKNPVNNTNNRERYAEYVKQRNQTTFLCKQRVKDKVENDNVMDNTTSYSDDYLNDIGISRGDTISYRKNSCKNKKYTKHRNKRKN